MQDRGIILEELVSLASRDQGRSARVAALRTEARGYADLLALGSTGGSLDLQGLRELFDVNGTLQSFQFKRPRMLAELGSLLVISDPTSNTFGGEILAHSIGLLRSNASSRIYRRLLVQYYIAIFEDSKAIAALDRWPDLDRWPNSFLRTDLMNPFRRPGQSLLDFADWLERFNAPLRDAGLAPLDLETKSETPFDSISVESTGIKPSAPANQGSLVSVVMTTFCPSLPELTTSVMSILQQTYRNLELIIIDDASPDSFAEVLDRVAELDSRISVYRRSHNRGTYACRDFGYSVTSGEFITGQDGDDWSHPDRLERQVEFLEANERVPACKVRAIACSPDMTLSRVGYGSIVVGNASSLMFRAGLLPEMGGFLSARKGADTEFALRLEKLSGEGVAELPVPLTVIRLGASSLSRGEFSSGWQHPARRAFKSAYKRWHEVSDPKALAITDEKPAEVAIPYRFRVSDSAPKLFDVIFVSDWRERGDNVEASISEVCALVDVGRRVGILHLEDPRGMHVPWGNLPGLLQDLINSGQVEQVMEDDQVETRLLLVRNPLTLIFQSGKSSTIRCHGVGVVGNWFNGLGGDGSTKYIVSKIDENCESMFGQRPIWIPQNDATRGEIESAVPKACLATHNLPPVISGTAKSRKFYRGTLPVAGRTSEGELGEWPVEPTGLKEVYPVDGSVDVRLFGDVSPALKVLKLKSPPISWTVWNRTDFDKKSFLQRLDYFLWYQQGPLYWEYCRPVLEALSEGAVVVGDRTLATLFGDAVIWAQPRDAGAALRMLQGNPALYGEQSGRGSHFIETTFGEAGYVANIGALLKSVSVREVN